MRLKHVKTCVEQVNVNTCPTDVVEEVHVPSQLTTVIK